MGVPIPNQPASSKPPVWRCREKGRSWITSRLLVKKNNSAYAREEHPKRDHGVRLCVHISAHRTTARISRRSRIRGAGGAGGVSGNGASGTSRLKSGGWGSGGGGDTKTGKGDSVGNCGGGYTV